MKMVFVILKHHRWMVKRTLNLKVQLKRHKICINHTKIIEIRRFIYQECLQPKRYMNSKGKSLWMVGKL